MSGVSRPIQSVNPFRGHLLTLMVVDTYTVDMSSPSQSCPPWLEIKAYWGAGWLGGREPRGGWLVGGRGHGRLSAGNG